MKSETPSYCKKWHLQRQCSQFAELKSLRVVSANVVEYTGCRVAVPRGLGLNHPRGKNGPASVR